MVPGVASNTSDSFPMSTELTQKVYSFLKGSCQDFFFDVLTTELESLSEVAQFYKRAFIKLQFAVTDYFKPLESMMKVITCSSTSLDRNTPLRNVMSKTYQSNYKKIQKEIFTPDVKTRITREIV